MERRVSKAGKRRGKAFEREWWAGMQEFKRQRGGRVRIQRFYDLSDYVGKYCPVCKQRLDICGRCHTSLPAAKAQPPRQPSDFETVWQRMSILQECKTSKSRTAFDYSNIKPHQMFSLLNNIMAGGYGFFIIQDRSNSRDIKVYCVDAQDLSDLHSTIGRVSIPWPELAKISISSPPRVRLGEGTSKETAYDYAHFLQSVEDWAAQKEGRVIHAVADNLSDFVNSWGPLQAQVKGVSHSPSPSVSGSIFLKSSKAND